MVAPVQASGTKVTASCGFSTASAKATFAVPTYEYDAGLKTFADIAGHRAELDGKIYGIEPGSSANAAIQKMIATNQFGLGGFKLIESSEAGMLVTVDRAVRDKKWVVFLGGRRRRNTVGIR